MHVIVLLSFACYLSCRKPIKEINEGYSEYIHTN